MDRTQQDQAREAFDEAASVWHKQSVETRDYSLIQNRNALVLNHLSSCAQGARFLDIGCGTGQLVVEAARCGYHANGIDYSDAMIEYGLSNAREAKVVANFELSSIFDVSTSEREYDVISALGLIEYLPQPQLVEFFQIISEMLAVGGTFLFGTRNRLFNVVSLNEFTNIEIELGNFENLLRQAIEFQSPETKNRRLEFLKAFTGIEPQPDRHPNTGVNVDTRYQYSPGELYGRLQSSGYQLENVYPVHYHAFPPGFKQDYLVEHERIARFVQDHAPTDLRIVPWCSTLVFATSRTS